MRLDANAPGAPGMNVQQAIANTRSHLLSLRNAAGHWEGELSSSALATATAVVALHAITEEGAYSELAVVGREGMVGISGFMGGGSFSGGTGGTGPVRASCWQRPASGPSRILRILD